MAETVRSSDLSPIYRDLYNRVTALPAFDELEERVHKDMREAQILSHTYSKAQYGNNIDCKARIQVGSKVCEIEFRVEGGDKSPYINLESDHLVTEEEVDKIYFENVARYGKPIRPHGLVKEDTVKHGAQPRGKNQFSSFAISKILNSKEFDQLKARVKQRIHQELMARLTDDDAFVQFSEDLQMEDIVSNLLKYSHLPIDVLHRAVDLMYVKAMMEK